jgi:Holliday junction DNA helicase RuvA
MSFRKRTKFSAPASPDGSATLPESDSGPRAAGPLAFVAGTLHSVTDAAAIVLSGGLGWRLICPDSTLRALPTRGSAVTLHAHLHLFEGGVSLYGFLTRSEQQVFELVTQVSGVSRSIAIGMLSAQAPRDIVQAIATGSVVAHGHSAEAAG